MRTKRQIEREFSKILASRMYPHPKPELDERLNAIARLLTELFNRVEKLEGGL